MYNNYQELSKTDKKIVRELMENGITEHFRRGVRQFDDLIQQLKNSSKTPKEQYHELFSEVIDFDKHIAELYDGRTGSRYLLILANQIFLDLVDEKELDRLSPDTKEKLLGDVRFMRKMHS
ncbi:hypothetical protein AAFN85_21865 [Mucilaginibacter sp. CAU 1740]|uniref:hypothetical protein n=1 Tax=Mucilaginibacter sp. CAU 1740 TaxID=3140365 RepID=UPI00325A6E3D